MALPVFQSAVSHSGNPTTAPSATLGTTAANDVLIAVVCSGGSNTTPTLAGTYSGGAWTLVDNGQLTTTGNVAVYWSRCTGNHTGQTVTSTTVDSGSLTVARYSSVLTGSSPIGANKQESITTNAANPGLSAFTTTAADSKVVLAVGADDNLAVLTAASATSALSVRSAPTSSGGADSEVAIADRDQASAGTTGAFTTTWGANAAGTGKYLLGFELLGVTATNHTATPADNVSVADSTTRVKAAASTQADNVTVADTATQAKAANQTPADNVTVADSLTRQIDASRTVTDNIGVADQATAAKAIFLTFNDGVTVADSAATVIGKAVTADDGVTVTDQASTVQTFVRSAADTVNVSDQASTVQEFNRAASDTVSVADATATVKAISVAPADSVTVADDLARALDYVRVAADSVTVTDNATPVLGGGGVNHTLQVDDGVTVADALARTLAYDRSTADQVAVTDSATILEGNALTLTVNDGVTVTDMVTVTQTTGTPGGVAVGGDSAAYATRGQIVSTTSQVVGIPTVPGDTIMGGDNQLTSVSGGDTGP